MSARTINSDGEANRCPLASCIPIQVDSSGRNGYALVPLADLPGFSCEIQATVERKTIERVCFGPHLFSDGEGDPGPPIVIKPDTKTLRVGTTEAPLRCQRFPAWRGPHPSHRALLRNFRRFLIGVGVYGAGDFSHTLLILAAAQLLTSTHGAVTAAQIAALLYALRNVLQTAASYPVGSLSDRLSRRGLLVFGYVLGAVVMVGFIVAFLTGTSSILWLGVLFGLAGVYIAVEDALEGVLTVDMVPEESIRGTAYGVMGTVNGVGDFHSSAVVGLLWSFSLAAGFGYAAVAMLLGAVLLARVR